MCCGSCQYLRSLYVGEADDINVLSFLLSECMRKTFSVSDIY